VPPDGRRRVDDHGEVDRDAEVTAQRVADRAAQDPLDGVLGELAGRGEERGAVDEPERSGRGGGTRAVAATGAVRPSPRPLRTGRRSPGSRPARDLLLGRPPGRHPPPVVAL
jgi:hypothetical protein